ncbi:MAG: hypothetical protein WDO12_15350 [Pseudomonadota bacterium]
MTARWWWLRLLAFQWINAWRTSPVRRTLMPSAWLLPAIALPAALSLAGEAPAAAGMDWVLSFDTPLELLLAAQVGVAIVALGSRIDTESWISPATTRGIAGKALFAARLLGTVRWPAGLALAALLLSLGSPRAAAHLFEMLLVDAFALVGGASLAWLLLGQRRQAASTAEPASSQLSHRRGLSALSWVPLREANRLLQPRRLALLAVPVLLLAPMGTAAQEVLRAVLGWTLLMYVASWWRSAAQVTRALERWMPHATLGVQRMRWYIWRYVALATLIGAATLWFGWRFTAHRPAVIKP